MFENLERELMEGEPWASGLVNSPVWNTEKINIELTTKQPVNSCQNREYAKFWLPVFKFFS